MCIVLIIVGIVAGLVIGIVESNLKERKVRESLDEYARKEQIEKAAGDRWAAESARELETALQMAIDEVRKQFPEDLLYDNFFAHMNNSDQMRTYFWSLSTEAKEQFIKVRLEVENKLVKFRKPPLQESPSYMQNPDISDYFRTTRLTHAKEDYETELAYQNIVSEVVRAEFLRERLVRDEISDHLDQFRELKLQDEIDMEIKMKLARGDNRPLDIIKRDIIMEHQEAEAAARELVDSLRDDGQVKCPNCGSTQLSSDRKNFGVGKALVGGAIAGPVGLLAGNIGTGARNICLACGHRWKPGAD